MAKGSTCKTPGCDKTQTEKSAKSLCPEHYREYLKNNSPRCVVDGCESPSASRGMCGKHAQRLKRHGRVDDDVISRMPNVGECSVEGCENPMRKRTWCASHYSQWRRFGEVRPFSRKWGEKGGRCLVCDAPCSPRRRSYCSGKCQVLAGRSGGVPAKTKACTRCGSPIDMYRTGKAGRKKRADVFICDHCHRAKSTRHGVSVTELVARDGSDCSICGDEVDLSLKHPDMFRASVDHIIPFSVGGPHDIDNLALAHLWCNQAKSNRVGWSLIQTE